MDASEETAADATEVCPTCHVELCATCHACRCARGMGWTCGFPRCPANGLPLSELPLEERDPEAEEVWRDMQREA